jgi:ABC-type transport system involved in cytochrome bd biosynthesis fused ATPase/permease subunit
MFRWATAVATVAIIAILLALFEPALAVSDAQRLLLILLVLPLVRSPLWMTGFWAYEVHERAANS